MRQMLALLLAAVLLSGCAAGAASDEELFNHTYRIDQMQIPENAPQEQARQIRLDEAKNLWIMDDLTTFSFAKLGKFQKQKDTDLWTLTAEDGACYELHREEHTPILTRRQDDAVCWTYTLAPVDGIGANLSSGGVRSFLEIDWFYADTFPGNLELLSAATIRGKGTLGLSVADPAIETLTLLEEYHTGETVETTAYTLTKEDGFALPLAARSTSDKQYALYRIPYETGEFLFYLVYIP